MRTIMAPDVAWVVVVLTVVSQPWICLGRCGYGPGSDCILPCRCAYQPDCSREDMTCPSGCATGYLGYDWGGPACQIGNVALGKFTVGAEAVDGQIGENNCLHVIEDPNTRASVTVNLGAIYRIYNITIIFHDFCPVCSFNEMHSLIEVEVTSATNEQQRCGSISGNEPYPLTYTMDCPVIGRYVHVLRIRDAFAFNQLYICEVIVMGHKYIDCSRCSSDVTCDDVIGCEQCLGSYQPDCAQACDPGYYGTNCDSECGQCLDRSVCDATSGKCPTGCVKWWAPDNCHIFITKPEPAVNSSKLLERHGNSIVIGWEQPTIPGEIAHFYGYEIRYKKNNDLNERTQTELHRAGPKENQATILDLDGNTWFQFTVLPFREWTDGVKDYGTAYAAIRAKTTCRSPDRPVLKSATRIPVVDEDNEKVDIIFEPVDELESGCVSVTRLWVEYRRDGDVQVYSRELPDVSSRTYTFSPEYGGTYDVWIKVQNNEKLNSTSTIKSFTVAGRAPPSSEVPMAIVIPSVLGGVIIIILIIILAVCCKRKHSSLEEEYSDEYSDDEDMEIEAVAVNGQVLPNRPPRSKKRQSHVAVQGGKSPVYENFELPNVTCIDTVDFVDYVLNRLNGDNFTGEYKSLPPADQTRCVAAKFPNNYKKNRFRNIYPYDETRVLLRTDDSLQGDFINASYITGYYGKDEYIATQGPCDTTVLDFWWMVWQEQANRIIMVANRQELGKIRCSQYWPLAVGETQSYGPFIVTTESIDVCSDYTTRVLSLQKHNKILRVHQFHFTSWQDKNKPLYGATTLLSFFRKVHAFDKFSKGPMVVHCSAGVGRTGTFIALDILQYQAAIDGSVDVFRVIRGIRNERMLMVQTKAQYIFIHSALVEFISCGDTSYACTGFEKTFMKLCSGDPQLNGMSRLERQFQLLESMRDDTGGMRSKDGLSDTNRDKNRNLDIVPDDFDRPHLSGPGGEYYINAVFVDSFHKHDFNIVTQMPLPHTVADFWRMVAHIGTRNIIMLNQFDNTDKTSKPYWPTKDQPMQRYGQVEVSLVSEGSAVDCIYTREFTVRNKQDKRGEEVKVMHYQLLTWPNTDQLPPKPTDLLMLHSLVKARNRQTDTPQAAGNTVIHCLTGGVQSGVYCGMNHVLDRMSVEHEIDAFLAVRYVSRRRPHFFSNIRQFRFLYEIGLEAIIQNAELGNGN